MEALAVVQDVIPREGKVLSPGHLTEVGFDPRGLMALDIPVLIEKARHSCHLRVFSHAVSRPQTECHRLFFFFLLRKRKAASYQARSVPDAPEKGAHLSNSEHLASTG